MRLWSIGQQRCIETFRLHTGGVWALEVDDSFKYFYSGGKDRNIYLTDMTNSMLFTRGSVSDKNAKKILLAIHINFELIIGV